jgi:anti-anti-sigma factor
MAIGDYALNEFPHRHVRGASPESDILHFWSEETPEAAVLHARGEVDLWTAPALAERLDHFLQRGANVILDLSDLSYFDLSGLEVVEEAIRRFSERERTLLIASPAAIIRRILDALEIRDLQTFQTVKAARDFLREQPA